LSGLALALAALGVFFKDLPQVVAPLVQLMMFLSPVFYPLKSLPKEMQEWAFINPMVPMIEGLRGVMAGGYTPDWGYLGGTLLLSAAFLWVTLHWFNRTKVYFADSI
jgi:lipopolysaccharide transport system permease protein